MKKLILFLITLAIPVVLAVVAYNWLKSFDTPGYVLMGFGHWALETTLAVFAVALIFSFFVFHYCLGVFTWVAKLPGRLRRRGKQVKFNRSQEALIAGLVDAAEGNFEKAEGVLIKHASHSGAPLLHYLTAARAAQSRGAFDKRDEYLKKAAAHAPGADIAIGLTQAELHLSGKEFDQALGTLANLHAIQPTHAGVLKLLHQVYQHVGDWEGIRRILPTLHTHKVLMETEIKLLETEAFSKLLKQAAEFGDVSEIATLWADIPPPIKKMPGISAIYFAAMINAGAGAQVEEELAATLAGHWDATLLVLYGSIRSGNGLNQLQMAERWLDLYPKDAVLLMVLGKLSMQNGYGEKAQAYLSKSLGLEPTVQAYQLLGDCLFDQGDLDGAAQYYKKGLQLASAEIVSRIDSVS